MCVYINDSYLLLDRTKKIVHVNFYTGIKLYTLKIFKILIEYH